MTINKVDIDDDDDDEDDDYIFRANGVVDDGAGSIRRNPQSTQQLIHLRTSIATTVFEIASRGLSKILPDERVLRERVATRRLR
jgi:hypothetical protein